MVLFTRISAVPHVSGCGYATDRGAKVGDTEAGIKRFTKECIE